MRRSAARRELKNRATPPIPIAAAPIANGLLSRGANVAAVPVVPHKTAAASTDQVSTLAPAVSDPNQPAVRAGERSRPTFDAAALAPFIARSGSAARAGERAATVRDSLLTRRSPPLLRRAGRGARPA